MFRIMTRQRISTMTLSLFLTSLSTQAWAQASDTADEAELRFELGAEAYQAGDYRRALEHFLVSNRLSPNQNVTYNIARVYERLGRYAEAYRYYQRAMDGAPSQDAKDKLQRALDALEKSVAVLDVKTFPSGATLYVDRVELGPRGQAPRRLGLSPGKYRIIARKAGYKDASIDLDQVNAGQQRSVELTLDPLLGQVAVTGKNLEGATVSSDTAEGTRTCATPCELALPPGLHVVRVTRPGYRTVESVVDVQPERVHRVVASLEPSTGVLVIEADEVGALVEVDDRPVGFTPTLVKVPVGKHLLRVTHPGSAAIEREIVIVEEETTKLALSFDRVEEVVAASRRAERAIDAPSSVTIIPREELRLFAYPTIAEALRGVQGVYQWNDRAYPSLGVRGIGRLGSYGNRVLVLNDDQPTNDNWVGSSYVSFDGRTDLADVERIEIVRGPGSVLFGTNAFAGVVNVVSRDVGKENQTDVAVSAVQDSVGRVRVRQDVRISDKASVWASAAMAKGWGSTYQLPTGTPGELIDTDRKSDGFVSGTAQTRFKYQALTLSLFGNTHEKHQPTGWFESIVGDDRAKQRDTRAYAELRFEPKIGEKLTSLSRVHLNYYGYRGDFPRDSADGGVEHDTFDGSWVGLEQRVVYAPFKQLNITVGGEGQYHFLVDQYAADSDGVFLDDQRDLLVGAAYGMLDVFLPGVRVSAGARFDAYSTFGSSVNPRVAVVGNPYSAGTTKLIVGKAFRAPSIYELYYNDGGFTQVASPNLGPESVWSAEVQHIHSFSKTVSVSIGAFANRISDLVTTRGDGTSADPIQYENSAEPMATAGIEARVRREWGQGWMLEGTYSITAVTFLDSTNWGDLFAWKSSSDYQDVSNVPMHLATVKGAAPIIGKLLTLGSRLTIESSRYTSEELVGDGPQDRTPGFFIWDLVFAGEDSSSGVHYSLGVYNVFDTSYSLPVSPELRQNSFAQAGRSLLADIGVTF